jgi:tetratricopeptide (TPR) repeat protein
MHPEAAALYKRGLERFGARDYAAAVADLEAGYAIEPRREFLFAEGQAKRLAGDCKGAVALYQRFLATTPSPVQANATQIALGRCAQHLAAHPEVVVVQTPGQPLPPPPPPPWWRDPVGVGFTGAGVVGIGVGIGFIAASYAAQHDAQSSPTYDPYDQRWATAESRWQVGVGTLALGTALAAVGVTRFVLLRREHAREAAAPPPAVSIGPGRLQVGGAF